VGFSTNDVLEGDIQISRSILGQNAAALTSSGWLSGLYDPTSGRFTITANGDGPDTAFVQFTNAGGTANDNLTTNVPNRNQNIVILRGVNAANLQNINFGGVNGANVLRQIQANAMTLGNGSWSADALFLNLLNGQFFSNAALTTLAPNVAPNTDIGVAAANALTTVNLANLGGANTGVAVSAGVTVNVGTNAQNGALARITGTNGDDNFVFADQTVLTAARNVNLVGNGGNNTLTLSTAPLAVDLGDGVGSTLIGIQNVVLTAGSGAAVTINAAVATPVAVRNASAAAASTVILGNGAAHTFTSGSTAADTVTLSLAGQSATFTDNAVNNVINGAVAGSTVNLTGGGANTLSVNAVGGNAALSLDSLRANYVGGAGVDQLTFQASSTATGGAVTTGTLTNIDRINFGAVGTATVVSVNPLTTGLTTITGSTANANLQLNMSLAQVDALTLVTSASAANGTLVINAASGTGAVNLSDTVLTTLANQTFTFANAVQVTADENVIMTGSAGADTVTYTADLGAVASAAAAFETVNVTAAQTGLTFNNAATTETANAGGVFLLGTGGDNFTGSGTAAYTVTDNTGVDTITLTSTAASTITPFASAANGADTYNLNAGVVTVGYTDVANQFGANADTITGFTVGNGGDVLRFTNSFSLALAGSAKAFVAGTAAVVGVQMVDPNDVNMVVVNGVGYANYAAVQAALVAAGASENDGFVVTYFDTTVGSAVTVYDTDITTSVGEVRVATLTGVDLAGLGQMNTSNFAYL